MHLNFYFVLRKSTFKTWNIHFIWNWWSFRYNGTQNFNKLKVLHFFLLKETKSVTYELNYGRF